MENKLKEVLDYIHNYFIFDTYTGKIKITNHQIDNHKIELADNQYFMIKGSKFNDGLWKYEVDLTIDDENLDEYMTDEEFYGDVYLLAIPRDVLNLIKEISDWETKNADALNGVFQSESFGGYSYSLKAGSGSPGSSALSWKDVFGNKLKAYRKLG